MPGRVINAVNDPDLKMAACFDAVADACALPRAELAKVVSPMLLSFMSESRRLSNRRLKLELGVRLRYATVALAD